MAIYLDNLYNRLLEHRYRYYILADPVEPDHIYDYLEKEYNRMAQEAGHKIMEMVDFNLNDPLAIEAKNRVDSGIDYHSLWLKEMQPVWENIGKPHKDKKKNDRKLPFNAIPMP